MWKISLIPTECWLLFQLEPGSLRRFVTGIRKGGGWTQLGGVFKYFWFSPRKLGKISNLTHIFQMGWFNHQLVKVYKNLWKKTNAFRKDLGKKHRHKLTNFAIPYWVSFWGCILDLASHHKDSWIKWITLIFVRDLYKKPILVYLPRLHPGFG